VLSSKTTKLKVENLAQTTSRFSPVSYRTPRTGSKFLVIFSRVFVYLFIVVQPYTSKNIDCLMVHTACLVCFISTINGRSNNKRKEKKKLTLGRPALVAGT
jgi:hypothetical protein